jgi:hypothetical protein
MTDQVDKPDEESFGEHESWEAAGRADGAPETDITKGQEGPAPFGHTRWQNFIREMWLILGPAQTGLPPYATPEERETWRLANLPQPSETTRASTAPPGYRITEYTDGQGYVHRSLVPTTPPDVEHPRKPGEPSTGARSSS